MQLHPQDYIKIDFHFETMKLKPETGYAEMVLFGMAQNDNLSTFSCMY